MRDHKLHKNCIGLEITIMIEKTSDIDMCDEVKCTCNHHQEVKNTFSATENLDFVCPKNTWLHHYQIFL
jgi:hypothetical protein